jgi:hypothetical protein
VRAYNGPSSGWSRLRYNRTAVESARALTKDISFEPATGAINDRFDDAYRAKYKSSAYLQPMIDTRARSATVKIVLAGVKRKFPNVWSSNQSGMLA